MKFFTNKIATSNNGSFQDLIEKVAGSNQQVKTASVKTAEEGLSPAQEKLPDFIKDKIKGKDKGSDDKDCDHTEDEDCCIDDKEASSEDKIVVAECDDSDEDCVRTDVHHGEGSPKDQNGEAEEDGENKTVECNTEDEVKVASDAGDGDDQDGVSTGKFPDGFEPKQEAQEEGGADVAAASTESEVKEASEDSDDDSEECEEDKECSASSKANLQKIANLKPQEKKRLKEYFHRYHPESYADALTQDK